MIYEKVPRVENLKFELMIAFDRRRFCEHFTKKKKIQLVENQLRYDNSNFWITQNPNFEKNQVQNLNHKYSKIALAFTEVSQRQEINSLLYSLNFV